MADFDPGLLLPCNLELCKNRPGFLSLLGKIGARLAPSGLPMALHNDLEQAQQALRRQKLGDLLYLLSLQPPAIIYPMALRTKLINKSISLSLSISSPSKVLLPLHL